MTTIYVDGKEYKVNKSDNLLKVCLSLGFNVPYFCWHPAIGSVGACRQCAVKQYQNLQDKLGRLVMSCMTPVFENMCISIDDEEAKQFRKNIIELLMINHPHDCPVCAEGGNCHLQDMTLMTGHNFRNYRFAKRTHYNQNLGPFISHEMNRCITCYRCIRYYRDYADGQDFGVYGTHDNIYFGRLKDGMLENEFSGNLVEVCPTGVFTDKIYSDRYSRKWDMQFSPSICHQCSLGCNISPGERYGEIIRIDNRYNWNINQYFLCDRGRFGHGYVNLKDRPRQPMQRHDKNYVFLNAEQAINAVTNILRKLNKVIGIGSSRASVESNFMLKELVGEKNFYSGIHKNEQKCLLLILRVLKESGIYTPTIREIESYDAILILGEDLTQTGARAELAVRQAIKSKMYKMASKKNVENWQAAAVMNIGQDARYPLFITNVDSTRLDNVSTWTYHAPIKDQARLGFAVANALDKDAPAVKNLSYDLQERVNTIAQALAKAKKPLIISGTNSGSIEIIQAAANIAKALKKLNKDVGITMIACAVNSIGLSMIGGASLEEALDELEFNSVDGVIVLENELYHHASFIRLDRILSKIPLLLVIDHQYTTVMKKANFILPAASFFEGNGTVVNNEGRAQRFFQVYDPTYYDKRSVLLESWRWLYALHNNIQDRKIDWTQIDHVIDIIAEKLPQLASIKSAAPNANFCIHGQKLARAPHRYSGRTAILANMNVHEPRQPQDMDTMFSFSMEGNIQPSVLHSQIPFVWFPGWNSSQALNKFQIEVGGHLRNSNSGVRLIEVSENNLNYFTDIPQPFKKKRKSWTVVPYYHLFGSDELSQRSPVFKNCIPDPYIKLNPIDAEELYAKKGDIISFKYEEHTISLPLIISENLTEGQIGLPMIGISGISSVLIGKFLNNLRKKEI